MDKFEILKSNTIQYTIEMNKTRISEDIIKEIKQSKIDSKKLKILNIDSDNKKNLKELKQLLDENKKLLKNGLYDYCLEENREIKDGLVLKNNFFKTPSH